MSNKAGGIAPAELDEAAADFDHHSPIYREHGTEYNVQVVESTR